MQKTSRMELKCSCIPADSDRVLYRDDGANLRPGLIGGLLDGKLFIDPVAGGLYGQCEYRHP
jgi:hypothetical protein